MDIARLDIEISSPVRKMDQQDHMLRDARLEWTIPIMVSSTQLLRTPSTTSSILTKMTLSKPSTGSLSREFRQALCQLEGYIHTAHKENQNEMLGKLKSLVAKFE
ncbi:unnamed protein product [Oikopleura dioica]|uniref:Uncharacterized protein n=1 Tax=Oikopleura dioica TaxID=34765 RepID=E4XYV4_OIKDI|nr:unnamed protein product [Oikopleura dioica]